MAHTVVDLLGYEETAGRLLVRVPLGSNALTLVEQKCRKQLELISLRSFLRGKPGQCIYVVL